MTCGDGRNISIHALLAESDRKYHTTDRVRVCISIHALLAESDHLRAKLLRKYHNFYPRSPCGERLRLFFIIFDLFRFLSTLSLRRATDGLIASANFCKFLSTLSLRRATLGGLWVLSTQIFLSTLSLRRATTADGLSHAPPQISIHALLAECDDNTHTYRVYCPAISIHALLAESDNPHKQNKRRYTSYFYPRSPCGERRNAGYSCRNAHPISIHALLAESDR